MHDVWEGGERQGLRWRRVGWTLLGLALAAGITVAVLREEPQLPIETGDVPVVGVEEEDQDVVVTAPQQAGERWLCPTTHRVRAYDDGLYYPPQHPAAPGFLERPAACYGDTARAEGAGYTIAATPDNAVVAGNVYLVPARNPQPPACAQVASTVSFAVPCPTRLPYPGDGTSCDPAVNDCLYSGGTDSFGVIIEAKGFPLPPDWCDGCDAHVVIAAARDGIPPALVSCDALAGDAPERGVLAVECPAGAPWLPGLGGLPHEDHTLLQWEVDGVVYAVSVEGRGDDPLRLAYAIRDGLELVDPPAEPSS